MLPGDACIGPGNPDTRIGNDCREGGEEFELFLVDKRQLPFFIAGVGADADAERIKYGVSGDDLLDDGLDLQREQPLVVDRHEAFRFVRLKHPSFIDMAFYRGVQ